MSLSGDLKKDIKATKIIPLKTIITDSGGPDINKYFNLYYIHWWSLTHFLIHHENGRYKAGFFGLVKDGGTLEAFEKQIGPAHEILALWYPYLQNFAKTL
jgi:hypothetical protein